MIFLVIALLTIVNKTFADTATCKNIPINNYILEDDSVCTVAQNIEFTSTEKENLHNQSLNHKSAHSISSNAKKTSKNNIITDLPTTITSTHSTYTETPITVEKSVEKSEESFNYASFDCGALIRAANKEATHSTSILQNSKDAYMLNPCSADKFVEIEVCQSILVKEITLANFEFFSSQFKDFAVFGSSKLPPDWILLGNFSAKNVRDRQHFIIQDPKIWSKHVRIEFTSHHGQEFYCPLTSVQIFGTTMLDDPVILLPSTTSTMDDSMTSIAELVSTSISEPSPTQNITLYPIPTFFARNFSTCTTLQDKLSSSLPDKLETNPSTKPTSLPSPTYVQQESVFAKIIHRIALLEKSTASLDVVFLNLQSMMNTSKSESQLFLKDSEIYLKEQIDKQVIQKKGNLISN